MNRENVMREALSDLEAQRANNIETERQRREEARAKSAEIAALLDERQKLFFSGMRGAFASPEKAKQISKAVIKRLPRYYRYLGELLEDNVERISSNDLSKKMRVTASQIRQDLNNFGGFGQQGYGYNVKYLYTEIGKILGLDIVHPMIIVGAGNLGQALANYVEFEKRGFKLVGIFDVNPVLEGIAVRGIEIQMISDLPFFMKENNIEIAILTLPKNKARDMAEILIENGIKAIWNFAHIDLDTPDDVIVENVHLSESLMTLSYNLSQYRQEHIDDEK